MPNGVHSTNLPDNLRYDQLLGSIQKLNGRAAAIQRGLKAITKNPKTALRPAIEQLAEELICFLDETDGDPDLEDGNDAEPDEDGEPGLGSTNSFNQERWSQGDHSFDWCGGEREFDPAESGIGDADGLLEQTGRAE